MAKSRKHHSHPPVHPGEILAEITFPALGVSKVEIAKALGVSRNTLHLLLAGKIGVSAEMAVRLAHVVGGSEESWLASQASYDLEMARKSVDTRKLTRLSATGDPGPAT